MISSIKNFKMEVNEDFIKKAEILKPILHESINYPQNIVKINKTQNDYEVIKLKKASNISEFSMGKGDSIYLDFGDHNVGYLSFKIKSVGSPPDAPAHIKIKLGEHPCEIVEESSSYNGAISSSWIQEEFLHIDVLPTEISMPRRYAFRYVEINVLDTSPKYKIVIESIYCKSVTSGDRKLVDNIKCNDKELEEIDKIALKTMEDCMQYVFEDGPKRDRRLWLGDLRLQALTNYATFKNYDLVKRCLYLFAGVTQNEKRVGACIFTEPKISVDDTTLLDYSLFFITSLYDYYIETKDKDTLIDLWETAYHQIELAEINIDENGLLKDSEEWWCFIDWQENLNKQASCQAILIYVLKQAIFISNELEDKLHKNKLTLLLNKVIEGAKNYLWDSQKKFFVSGSKKQISWASQVWFVLANILSKEENKSLLERLKKENPKINMVTPYMNHYYVEALIQCNMMEEAKEYIKYYWGGMVKLGADCFWELFDPNNIYISPYGSRIINSYCHAWSCTPSYIIRKYYTN